MDPQNPGPNGAQPSGALPSPQTPYDAVPAPQPPAAAGQPQPVPQVYGPPQAAVPNQGPPPNQDKGRSIWVIVGIVAGLVVLAIAAAVFLAIKGADVDPQKSVRAYDSPVGLLAEFQAKDIRAAKFKLSASYVSGGSFNREGKLYLDQGHGSYEMLTDTDKVNELIKSLHTKKDPKATFSAKDHGATRNFSYDFNALLGYQYLYDQNSTVGGYIAAVQAGQKDTQKATAAAITATENCDAALADVMSKTGPNMTTRSLFFDYSQEGLRKKATVSYASRQTLDRSVRNFFEKCYNLESPAAAIQKTLVEKLKENTTKSPSFIYWTENGKLNLVIEPDLDTIGKAELKFELSDLNAVSGTKEGETSSFIEKRNMYGLTYSLCRVPPVVASNTPNGYVFLPQDEAYKYPADTDSVYYCTTQGVSGQYQPPATMNVKYDSGVIATATGGAIPDLRAMHDIQYQIERFNSANKRYPSSNEFNDLINNNMEKLTNVAQGLARGKLVAYTPAPGECVGNCNDYSLAFSPQTGLKLGFAAYEP